MRILYIAAGGKYGSDKSLLNILDEARKYGYAIFVIINKKNGLEIELEKRNIPYSNFRLGLNCFEKPDSILGFLTFPLKIALNIKRVISSIKKGLKIVYTFKPDIIHSNVGLYSTGYYISRIVNIPHVWHLREFEDLDFNLVFYGGKRWFEKKLAYKTNYSIAISKSIYHHFHLDGKSNSIILYNGIISSLKNERCINKDDFFVYIGNVNERKGVTEMVEAFCNISSHCDYRLVVCGEYEDCYYKKLKKKFGNISNFSKIEFRGYHKDAKSLLRTAAAIIVPSFYEALGRTVIEAMNNNCLVIGRNTGGIKEQFDNGFKLTGSEIGLRFDNISELTDILDKIVRKQIVYDNKLELAEKTVHHYFEIDKYFPKIEKIYNDCYEKNRSSFGSI